MQVVWTFDVLLGPERPVARATGYNTVEGGGWRHLGTLFRTSLTVIQPNYIT